MNTETVDLAELSEDGDTIDYRDGVLTLRIMPDDVGVVDLWEDECYGRIAFVDDRPYYQNDYGYPPDRPSGFDGNAEKLSYDRGERVWWQPPKDVARGSEQFYYLRRLVGDILEYGFYSAGLEYYSGEDYYGRRIVRAAAWTGGIEPLDYQGMSEYLRDLLPDLLSELESQLEKE